MSVVVEHPDEKNKAICFVKGADTNILPLIKVGSKEDIEVNVEQFACKGLRTLCFAMKVIDWQ
jgi:magnesium-transporting ATPase (P-type)